MSLDDLDVAQLYGMKLSKTFRCVVAEEMPRKREQDSSRRRESLDSVEGPYGDVMRSKCVRRKFSCTHEAMGDVGEDLRVVPRVILYEPWMLMRDGE